MAKRSQIRGRALLAMFPSPAFATGKAFATHIVLPSRPTSPHSVWCRFSVIPGDIPTRVAFRRSTITIKSELMEPPESQTHYTERLVRL
jgi:hypothetical protein